VPVQPIYNVGEKSGIRLYRVIFTIGWLVTRLFFWRLKEKYIIRDFHPLVFFYLFGFLMLLVSAVLLLRVIVLWSLTGGAPELSVLAFLFSFSIGFNSIGFAMWFDFEANRHLFGQRNGK
jgi:hypothetical protein